MKKLWFGEGLERVMKEVVFENEGRRWENFWFCMLMGWHEPCQASGHARLIFFLHFFASCWTSTYKTN